MPQAPRFYRQPGHRKKKIIIKSHYIKRIFLIRLDIGILE